MQYEDKNIMAVVSIQQYNTSEEYIFTLQTPCFPIADFVTVNMAQIENTMLNTDRSQK